MSSCGTMSSNEELADQEGSAGASAFDQGEGASKRGSGGRKGLETLCGSGLDLPR